MVENNLGASVLIVQACTYLVYSFVMYLVFYILPMKYGLVTYKKRGVKEVGDI